MTDLDRELSDAARRHDPPEDWLERVFVRACRRRRNRRVAAVGIALGLSIAIVVPFALSARTNRIQREGEPASDAVGSRAVWRITASTRCIVGCDTEREGIAATLILYDDETAVAEVRGPGVRETWDIGGWTLALDGQGNPGFVLLDITMTRRDRTSDWIPRLDLALPGAAGRYPVQRFLEHDPPPGARFEVEVTKVPGAKVVNLALGASATASSSLEADPPSRAVDGDHGSLWNSGALPTQSIEVDLGASYAIEEIALSVAQLPDGHTVHRVYGRADANHDETLLHEFAGTTRDSEVLSFTPPPETANLRFIRVETIDSPSWVAWREIAVYLQHRD